MENLNKLQQDFVEKMCENIKNIYNGMYLLEAPAGCGKTFCVSYLIHKIPWIDYYVIAPTHKAKKMLSKNLNGNVETVHRFLNSKMEYTKDGEQEYTFNPPPIKNSLIFIDECSMINDEIYDIFLQKYAPHNIIIFAGDPLQLPPVVNGELNSEEDFSFKTRKSRTFDKSNLVERFELTENMRARKNPIGVSLITRARECIKSKSIPDFIAKTDIDSVLKKIKKDNLTDFVFLAYSNKKVDYYNKLLRAYLYNNGNQDDLKEYYKNEKLVFSGYRKVGRLNYNTSDVITIKDIETEEKELFYKTCNCADAKMMECKTCGIANHKENSLIIKFYKIKDEFKTKWYKGFNNSISYQSYFVWRGKG